MPTNTPMPPAPAPAIARGVKAKTEGIAVEDNSSFHSTHLLFHLFNTFYGLAIQFLGGENHTLINGYLS